MCDILIHRKQLFCKYRASEDMLHSNMRVESQTELPVKDIFYSEKLVTLAHSSQKLLKEYMKLDFNHV